MANIDKYIGVIVKVELDYIVNDKLEEKLLFDTNKLDEHTIESISTIIGLCFDDQLRLDRKRKKLQDEILNLNLIIFLLCISILGIFYVRKYSKIVKEKEGNLSKLLCMNNKIIIDFNCSDSNVNKIEKYTNRVKLIQKVNHVFDAIGDLHSSITRSKLKRKVIFSTSLPFGVYSNIVPIKIKFSDNMSLYIFPNFMIQMKYGYNYLRPSFEIIKLTSSSISSGYYFATALYGDFIIPPMDGDKVGEKWFYSKLDGTRDYRYKDNKKYDLFRYGELIINTGYIEKSIYFSNPKVADMLARDLKDYLEGS